MQCRIQNSDRLRHAITKLTIVACISCSLFVQRLELSLHLAFVLCAVDYYAFSRQLAALWCGLADWQFTYFFTPHLNALKPKAEGERAKANSSTN